MSKQSAILVRKGRIVSAYIPSLWFTKFFNAHLTPKLMTISKTRISSKQILSLTF